MLQGKSMNAYISLNSHALSA